MDAPNPIPAVKAAPGKISRVMKGHKPIVYVGVVGLALIIAYYIRRREANAATVPVAQDPGNATVTDSTSQTPDYGTPYAGGTFGPTDGAATGAYYGYSDPTLGGKATGWSLSDITDLIYALSPNGTAYSGQPAASPDPTPAPAPAATSPTGGGPAGRVNTGVVHAVPAKATPTPVVDHTHDAPPNPSFPFKSTRGWYRVEVNPKGHPPGRYHFYAPPPLGDGKGYKV